MLRFDIPKHRNLGGGPVSDVLSLQKRTAGGLHRFLTALADARQAVEGIEPAELPSALAGLGELQGFVQGSVLIRLAGTDPTPAAVPENGDGERFLSVREAAERLGASTDYVYSNATRFQVKGIAMREGSRWKFISSKLDAYIRGGRR
jgi:excisionase family DNA binding protein